MDIAAQGRFCQSCQKTVIDFTQLSDKVILEMLSSTSSICGRFDHQQLNILNAALTNDTPRMLRLSWKKLSVAAAAFIGFVPFIKVNANAKPPVETNPMSFKKSSAQIADTTKEFRVITGSVTDSLGEVLAGVTIRVKGTQFNTSTDRYGQFRLTIPASLQLTGLVSYIGFTTQEFKLDHQVSKYSFILKQMPAMLGEVFILQQPAKPVKAVKQK